MVSVHIYVWICMCIYIYTYIYMGILHPRVNYSVSERWGFRNTQEFFAVFHRSYALFIEVMHVSWEYCTFHRSCACFTSYLITFFFNCVPTWNSSTRKNELLNEVYTNIYIYTIIFIIIYIIIFIYNYYVYIYIYI